MMKRSRLFQFAVALTLVGLVLWIWLAVFAPQQRKDDKVAGAPAKSPPLPTKHQAGSSPRPSPTPDLSIYKTDPKWIWWNEQMERDRFFEWKMPISFYGKVVDQNDQPLEGVKVIFQWTDMSAKGTSEKTVYSDMAGRFDLTGVSGKNLGVIQVYKDGYYRMNKGVQVGFEYAAFFEPTFHQPDSNNPVLFRLRKAGEIPSELIVRESLIGLPANGAPQTIDLRTGSKVAAGDVRISVTRGEPNEAKRYDWSIQIEGANGSGLIESEDEFMFEAPEEGYLPEYSYRFDAGSPDWQGEVRKNYYVRSGNGTDYARLEIKFMPRYQQNAAARIRFFVNPTGSRNLEYQPNKVLPR